MNVALFEKISLSEHFGSVFCQGDFFKVKYLLNIKN